MKITNSVRKAIIDWEQGEIESAMLHACNAVDGTAKKAFPNTSSSNERFTTFLRNNYNVLGPMGAPGINLAETRFPVVLPNPKASQGKPDIADVIYGIHRCSHGHGQELPNGFELLEDAAGPARITHLEVKQGKVRLSDRIIFGLLAVVVLSPINKDLAVPELNGFYLTFGSQTKLMINDWWGHSEKFVSDIVSTDPLPLVTLDFGNTSRDFV